MENYLPCPQQFGTTPTESIFFALESASYLREEIDRVDTASDTEIMQLRQEVTMLRYWLETTGVELGDYHALSQGLADFVDKVQQRLPSRVAD